MRTYYAAGDMHEHVVAFGIGNYWIGDLGSLEQERLREMTLADYRATISQYLGEEDMV